MHIDSMYGPTAPESGWVPAPHYLMRRARILALTRELPPGDLLEVGCGAGMLLHEFGRRGFRCTALESSPAALALARQFAAEAGLGIQFHSEGQSEWQGAFDTVFAFEVMEHIEDDRAALAAWREWLRPGGRLVLSVPAHQSAWSVRDEWAGHFRRYERDGLKRLIAAAGFELERFECYGFPAARVTDAIGSRLSAKSVVRGSGDTESDRRANNDRSGIERSAIVRLYPLMANPFGRLAMACALALQKPFLGSDLGDGYVLVARRG
jgi:SAM-dependent methyltransferase